MFFQCCFDNFVQNKVILLFYIMEGIFVVKIVWKIIIITIIYCFNCIFFYLDFLKPSSKYLFLSQRFGSGWVNDDRILIHLNCCKHCYMHWMAVLCSFVYINIYIYIYIYITVLKVLFTRRSLAHSLQPTGITSVTHKQTFIHPEKQLHLPFCICVISSATLSKICCHWCQSCN